MFTLYIQQLSAHFFRLFTREGELVGEFNNFGDAKDYANQHGFAAVFDV
jgi:hypothetical protein